MTFDLKVHKRNLKGKVTHVQPYKLYIENGVQKFERPPNSGIFYSPNGELLSKNPKTEPIPASQAVEVKKEVAKELDKPVKVEVALKDSKLSEVLDKAKK